MAHRVIEFDLTRAGELRRALEGDGFRFRDIPYALFGATRPGIAVTLYRRGKLVIQGSGIEGFVERFLPGVPPSAAEAAPPGDRESLLGSDESGKGDYFGPLVVAAVLVPVGKAKGLRAEGVVDCKRMSDLAVLRLSDRIREGFPHAMVSLSPREYNARYDEVRNLNRILADLHAAVILEVASKHPPDRVLTDRFGDESLLRAALGQAARGLRLEQRPGAESETAVAAASVIARAEFLRALQTLRGEAGVDLPKGASAGVERAARELLTLHGREALGRFAKLHFKTTGKIGTLFP